MTRRTAVSAILSVAGVALLIWQVESIGLTAARNGLGRVGYGFILILVIACARFLLRSYAWMTLMRHPAPLRSALAATISGDALGNVTPLGLMASEPAKAVYLARYGDAEQALAALMAENFFYSVSVAIYITLGAAAMLLTFHVPAIVRTVGIATLAAMGAILGAAAWIAWQKPALASAVLARVPLKRLERWVIRVRDFEVSTYGSTGHERARLGRLAATEILFHVLSFTESWFTLLLVSGASQPVAALVFDSLNRIINIVFKVIPMKFGVDEFSSAQMADAIRIRPDVGLVMALVRKVRLVFWAIVGFGIYANRGLGNGRANLHVP